MHYYVLSLSIFHITINFTQSYPMFICYSQNRLISKLYAFCTQKTATYTQTTPNVAPTSKSANKLRTKYELVAACKCRSGPTPSSTLHQEDGKQEPNACVACAGRKAKLDNRLSRSAGDLLHEIDGALVLSKGFLFARGMAILCFNVWCALCMYTMFIVSAG